MNTSSLSRRDALQTGLLAGAALLGHRLSAPRASAQTTPKPDRPFLFALNTGTLRGHKLGIAREIEVASQAGYEGIEPWVDGVEAFVKNGGTLKELRARLGDAGLTVEGAIGFPEWAVDDDARRAKGLEKARREMDMILQIGGKRFAAPPAGATDLPKLDLLKAAERYRALLEIGDQIGIVPALELWGFSKNLNHLGECICVAMESGHPKACVVADVFHLYKGGSDLRGVRLLGPTAIPVLHMNDYPAEPPRDKIDDSYRVYAGDGVAPLTELLRDLRQTGGQKVLSFEVFNRAYYAQDPLEVAKTALAKMKAVADQAV